MRQVEEMLPTAWIAPVAVVVQAMHAVALGVTGTVVPEYVPLARSRD
jgi:hypothetical protein